MPRSSQLIARMPCASATPQGARIGRIHTATPLFITTMTTVTQTECDRMKDDFIRLYLNYLETSESIEDTYVSSGKSVFHTILKIKEEDYLKKCPKPVDWPILY